MKTAALITAAGLAILACGGEEEPVFSSGEMTRITTAAGSMARNLAFSSEEERWSPGPDTETLAFLDSLAGERVELWPVFFRAAADSASKIEQLIVDEQREQQQSELL